MIKNLVYVLVLIFLSINVFAQEDSIRVIEDVKAAKKEKSDTSHSVATAVIMSAALPGLGQIYNKSYWKVPVVYAGFAGFGVWLGYSQKAYKEYKTAYNDYQKPYLDAGLTPNADTTLFVGGSYSTPYKVKDLRNQYRRLRDLSIIVMSTWYLLQILEAYVDAHMFSYDISDDLTFRYEPCFYTSGKQVAGMRLRFSF